MSKEDRDIWAQKKCPFGVGNTDGKCCTTDCAAWREWDSRSTTTSQEERWENHKPGWFSDWKVADHIHFSESRENDDEGKEHWTPGGTMYLWVRETSREIGDAGGYCLRLNQQ